MGPMGQMANTFMNMANQYMNQFTGTTQGEEKKEGEGEREHPHCREWGSWQRDSKWKEKRAIVVRGTEEVLEGEPGQVIMATVDVQNQTKWPWKRGCYLG